MHERNIIHAIQDTKVADIANRYRYYKSKESRDSTFDNLQNHKPDASLVKVTLTITAETVNEQLSLEV